MSLEMASSSNENIPPGVASCSTSGEGEKFTCLLCRCDADKRQIVEDEEAETGETKAFLRFLNRSATDLVKLRAKSDVVVEEDGDEDSKNLKLLTNWRCEDCVRTVHLFSKIGDAIQILVTQTKYRFEYCIKTDVPNNVKQMLKDLIIECKELCLSTPWLIPQNFDARDDQHEDSIEKPDDDGAAPELEEENIEMETCVTPESPVLNKIDHESSTSSSEEVEKESHNESMNESESDEDQENPSSLEQTDKKELQEDQCDFKCDKCNESFISSRVLNRHMKLHDGNNALFSHRRCQYCFPLWRGDEDAMRTHLVEKHPLEFFDKKFPKGTKINRLNTVIRQLENRDRTNTHCPYECSICKDELKGMYHSRRHFLEQHFDAVLKKLRFLPKKNTKTGWKLLKNRCVTMKNRAVVTTATPKGRGRPKKVVQESCIQIPDESKKTIINQPGRLFCEHCGLIFKHPNTLTYHKVINHAQSLFADVPSGTCKKKLLAIANKFIIPVSYNVNGNKIKERYRCSSCLTECCAKGKLRCHVIVNHLKQVLLGLKENSKPKRVSFSEKAPGIFPLPAQDDELVEIEDEPEDDLDNSFIQKSDSEEMEENKCKNATAPVELRDVVIEEVEDNDNIRSPSPAPSIEILDVVENLPTNQLLRTTCTSGASNSFQMQNRNQLLSNDSDSEIEIIQENGILGRYRYQRCRPRQPYQSFQQLRQPQPSTSGNLPRDCNENRGVPHLWNKYRL